MTLRPLTLIGIILSIVTGTTLGVLIHVQTRSAAPADPALTLNDALRHVSERYVDEISEEQLLELAIQGMMEGLDDHSDYLSPAQLDALEANATGRFGGIGIELGLVDGFFTVITPMDDTPAARAGLAAGDRITALDDKPVKGMKMIDLLKGLRGQAGSSVRITVRRPEVSDPLTFDIERAVIQVTSVRSRLLESGYGYARISQFQTTTGIDLLDALHELARDNGAPLRGLVLDLRNNPGGTLLSSVEVADHFLDQGLIVYTEGRLPSSFARYRATRGDALAGAPIVVLINRGSASAAEIVAGALQDHGRARVLGSQSFGKGSVQSVVPLDESQALKITTARYFTPSGRSIHRQGIAPDVKLRGNDAALLAAALELLKAPDAGTLQARLARD